MPEVKKACDYCGGFAGFEDAPTGQVCDLCDCWVCDDCTDWSIDVRHQFPDLDNVCCFCAGSKEAQ